MSYHVTILRTAQGKQTSISSVEIEQQLASMAGWRFEAERSEVSFFANGQEVVTLWLSDGELWTKNPDDAAITKMVQLATALNARVRGDELESYRSAEETYHHVDDAALIAEQEQESQRAARKRRVGNLLFRFFQVTTVSLLSFFAVRYLVSH